MKDYLNIKLDDFLDSMREALTHYTTREIEEGSYVDHTTVWRFLNSRNISITNVVLLQNFLIKEAQDD